MKNTGVYKCAANAMWVDFQRSPNPNTPTTKSAIDEMKAKYFDVPKAVSHTIVVAVPDLNYNVLEHKGLLRRVSPNEPLDALLCAIAADIENGADGDRLQQWRAVLLTCQVQFELHTNEDSMFWRSQQLRENVLTDFTGMYPTAFQRIMTVVSYKAKREAIVGKVSAKALADSWRENVQMSSKAEHLSDTTIDNAVTVWTRLLGQPALRAVIMQADEELGHEGPFDSINKLHVIVTKGKTKENIAWIVLSVWDLIKSGARASSEFGTRALQGPGSQKGLCDFFVRKKTIMDYMNSTLLEELGLPSSVRSCLKDKFESHTTYRNLMPYGKETHQCDLSFLSTWKPSARKVFDLYDNLVYLTTHDAVILQGIRDRKGVPDMFDTSPVSEAIEQIKDAIIKNMHQMIICIIHVLMYAYHNMVCVSSAFIV